jgi:hypothetical protein
MEEHALRLELVNYSALSARQKETYNFQKVSAVLADYGYRTIRLSEDWESADFIAYHNDGMSFLKIQLKTRLSLFTKYKDKDIYICFPYESEWYLYPHDEALRWAAANNKVGKQGWEVTSDGEFVEGGYTWPYPPQHWLDWLQSYRLPARPSTGLQD